MKTKLTIRLKNGATASGQYETAELLQRLSFIASREDILDWRLG